MMGERQDNFEFKKVFFSFCLNVLKAFNHKMLLVASYPWTASSYRAGKAGYSGSVPSCPLGKLSLLKKCIMELWLVCFSVV